MRTYILPFYNIQSTDINLVGGKALNLGELTRAGLPVPGGFSVTTKAFRDFSALHNIAEMAGKELEGAADESIARKAATVRECIRNAEIPEEIRAAIISSIQEAGEEYFYAVRSSATAEDLSTASFAGQQDTYLHIHGSKNILYAIRDCWASLYTERAVLYRRKKKIPEADVSMAVVVQRMVNSEISGIMFTADPVNGNRNIISIDAGFGLGEALVSGLVTPDIYKFNKKLNTITGTVVSHKQSEIVALAGGGTEKRAVEPSRADKQVLTEEMIHTLAALGKKIEEHYGFYQDIEWCYEKGEFHIVQSRNITSLYPLPAPVETDNALHPYISLSHFQVMTDPISPMGLSVLRQVMAFDKNIKSDADYRIFKTAGGRAYIDASIFLQSKKIGPAFARFIENADGLTSRSLLNLLARTDFHDRIYKNRKLLHKFAGFMIPVIGRALSHFLFRKPEKNLPRVQSYINKRIAAARCILDQEKESAAKLDEIRRTLAFTGDFKCLLPALMPGMLGIKILEKLEQKWTGKTEHVPKIIQGLEGNITTEMGLLIGDLADMIRESPELLKQFTNTDYGTLFERIQRLAGQDQFKNAFRSFMDIYDMRSAGEIDIARDRWSENPEPLVTSLLSIVETAGKGEHRRDFSLLVNRAAVAAKALINEVKQKKGAPAAHIMKRAIRVVRNHLPAREHPKYLIMKLLLITKKYLLSEAQKLKSASRLNDEKDIFYLSLWELDEALSTGNSVLELIKKRKEEYALYKEMNPPRVMTNEGEIIQGTYNAGSLPDNALPGMPASAGAIEGVAKVVMDPAKESVKKGEILVTPFTDPGWTPLFLNASGLVMEIGGLLTHGTVVAREYGIPAVVGVSDATKIIRTGDVIRVDGNAGFVQIVSKGK